MPWDTTTFDGHKVRVWRERLVRMLSPANMPATAVDGGQRKRIEQNSTSRHVGLAQIDEAAALAEIGTSAEGLSDTEATARLAAFGPNVIARDASPTILAELAGHAVNPLNALLLVLAAISFAMHDARAALVIVGMVALSISTAFVQEHRSNAAAAKLRAMVRTVAAVKRTGAVSDADSADGGGFRDVPIAALVPGDIVRLSAGDMIPADLRLLTAKDFFVNQAALTGESMPVERHVAPASAQVTEPLELPNACFMGANVVSGYATAVVVDTGARTLFGQLADRIADVRVETDFDRGISRFTWLMLRFILVMVPAVFLINGLTKGSWFEALLFAVAVAVGLTPEMLPMIVTVNLAKGALAMSKRRVIVKRLNAIQNFGAMDVLCTDKTGTLTQDHIILKKHLDIRGEESARVLEYAYLNSHFQSGLKNLLDVAVLKHVELEEHLKPDHQYKKIDEIPFDFERRRLSVVVERDDGRHLLICKGAVEEMFQVCTSYEVENERALLDESHFSAAKEETRLLNADGFRVVAVAYKELSGDQATYSVADERELVLLGTIAFLDPPKDSARDAIAALNASGVAVKVLTGDNDVITRKICHEVGLDSGRIVLGREIESLSDLDLEQLAHATSVFAKVSPQQKARIIKALQATGHVVGFLGDGINDSLALKAADVGISVDTAVDIAKESADIILLEKSLLVLRDGVIEGRRVFGNIVKYIKMGASSNFGNMLSVLGASIFLPFLPMAPIQVLANNLLYDFSQTTIPTDSIDDEYVTTPRRWDIANIQRFMLVLGPVSSLFDYVTFGVMLWVFHAWDNPALFQTGWFVESILTQTLIIHIIRTAKVPFLESRASAALIATTIIVSTIGMVLPYTPVGATLGFVPLPASYWAILPLIIAAYAVSAHLVKVRFVRRWGL
jgi:P-type Mg2+ transporter